MRRLDARKIGRSDGEDDEEDFLEGEGGEGQCTGAGGIAAAGKDFVESKGEGSQKGEA